MPKFIDTEFGGAMKSLVAKSIANEFLPLISDEFKKNEVELRGCEKTNEIINITKATEEDWKLNILNRSCLLR